MKKRWPLYVIFGVVFYLLFLVIEMPASWFAWGMQKYSQGAVRLDPMGGGLWHGNGRMVVYYPRTMPHDLGNVQWSINPLWLFTGHIQTSWRTDAPDLRIDTTLRLGPGGVTLLDTDAALPAQAMVAFYPAASLISPQGQLRLQIPKLTADSNGITGDADVQWQNAGSSLTTVQPLGDYRLQISGTGGAANLKLSTQRGALELTGQGNWQAADGRFQFSGYASPRERSADLAPLLKLLGDDQGGGRWRLAFNGRLPLPGRGR
jgi:general secretion pathway protein N